MIFFLWWFLGSLIMVFPAFPLQGQTLDTSAAYTRDSQYQRQELITQYSEKASFDEEERYTLSVTASAGYAELKLMSSDSSYVQVWGDFTSVQEKSANLNLGFDYNKHIGVLTSVGRTVSQINAVTTYSLGGYLWFLQETLQLTYLHSENNSKQNSIDTIDRDAFRVITPEKIQGLTDQLSVLLLLTPVTIIDGTVTQIRRNDRPNSQHYSLGLKQYIAAWESAVHVNTTYFENRGVIKPITLQGETTAKSVGIKWLQRIWDHYIVQGGYRVYYEHEIPRAQNAEAIDRASDSIEMRLTYRNYQYVWTHPASEFYLYGQYYKNSDQIKATTYGLGFRWELADL